MDSLLANYGPSDDDEEEAAEEKENPSFDFNPPNRLSSLLASLPPPKPSSSSSSSSSSISTLLPPPKSRNSIPSKPSAKKVIQFKPPLNPSLFKSSNLDDDDDDDDDVKRKPSKELSPSSQNTTITNSLPFFLPPPKHSLCLAPPPSSSSGRRGLVETSNPVIQDQEKGKFENHLSKGGDSFDGLSSTTSTRVPGNDNYVENAANGSSYTSSDWVATNEEYATYENYGNYEGDLESGSSTNASSSFPAQENYSDIGSYRNYQSNWGDGAMAMTSSETLVDNVGRVGKRGRNEVPTEMVEVKQDELIGNRPREDQVKLTGIAFGPAYQPVSSSTKAKPTKLQKRKHQIGSLYFDMKQKEMELAERRARGFLTKAETQAKYGW